MWFPAVFPLTLRLLVDPASVFLWPGGVSSVGWGMQVSEFRSGMMCGRWRANVNCLPLHLVRLVTLAQAEGAGKVAGEEVDLLDAGNQSLVDGLLVSGAAAVDLLLLWSGWKLC